MRWFFNCDDCGAFGEARNPTGRRAEAAVVEMATGHASLRNHTVSMWRAGDRDRTTKMYRRRKISPVPPSRAE
jgi:hypothetical protein